MKKYLIYFAAVVAAASACTKELTPETQNAPEGQNGIPVSFTVGTPELGEVDENGAETKITETTQGSASGQVHNFQWTAGDIVNIYAFQSTPKAGVPAASRVIDCGQFIAQNSGSSATFSGTLPDSLGKYGYTKLYAIYNKGNKTSQCSYSNTADKYTITNVWLDPNQDGTAFKYCQFAAVGWTLCYTKTSDTDSIPSAINTNNKKFVLSDALLKIDTKSVSSSCIITKIEAYVGYPDNESGTEQYIAGNVTHATNNTGVNSAGSNKMVTIYRGGAQLPDTAYVAIRHTVGNKTASSSTRKVYGQAVLNLRFFYTEGGVEKIADKRISGIGYTSGVSNFSAGKIYKLKPITSLGGKPVKTISWTGSSSSIITAASGSGYKGFPYANNSTAGKVTAILDGVKGDTLVKATSSAKYYTEREYVFPNGKDNATIKVGAKSTGYYYYPATTNYIRVLYGYLEIPAIEGYRLAGISATTTNGSTKSCAYVCTDLSTFGTTTVENFKNLATYTDIPLDHVFYTTKANTKYYLYINDDRNIKMFTFTYIATE